MKALFAGLAMVIAQVAFAQPCVQQVNRLVGTGGMGRARAGQAVAINRDGNTALVGAPDDHNYMGGVFVFVRSGSSWTQQGPKLVPPGALSTRLFGQSVCVSSDGNTALIGAGYEGAAYVFVRSNGTWAQQGPALQSGGGPSSFGWSVSLSGDGNTALIGALGDNNLTGAAYIFVRSGTAWTQQGPKLVPKGAPQSGFFGSSVALSADGDTALIGADQDSNARGTAYVFVRLNGVWAEQGHRLLPSGNMGQAEFGGSVALSADGNTAIVGAKRESLYAGAAYIFVRTNGEWSQEGPRLLPTDGPNNGDFGGAVALVSDGNVAWVGAYGGAGAAYMFSRSQGQWTQQGSRIVATGGTGSGLFGHAISVTDDGRAVLVGDDADNGFIGAAYVFAVGAVAEIVRQPEGVLAPFGGSASFSVVVDSFAPVQFQWRRDGVNLVNGTTTTQSVVAGATAALLTLSNVSASDVGSYDCVVSSQCGQTMSDGAPLGVCTADIDMDRFVSGADFDSFVQEFEAGNTIADVNRDGIVSEADFDFFIQAFETGC